MENAWRRVHRGDKAFDVARDGEHLLIPLECEQCIFVKLRDKLPNFQSPQDRLLMACLRRMNLDACWSRETQTVNQNSKRAQKQIEMCKLVGLDGPFVQIGNLPEYDYCGYEVAISILLYSRKPGKYNREYTQYDTIRQFCSTYSNYVRASPQGNSELLSLGDFNGNYSRLVPDECGSLFFKRFMEGLKKRMGQDWRPNIGLSTALIVRVLHKAEDQIVDADTAEDTHLWIVFVAYVTISYVISLRGPEGLLLDLHGLIKHWRIVEDYVVIALLGRVKGESHDRSHLIPCTVKTSSNIDVRRNLKRLIEEKQRLGFSQGPAISDIKGNVLLTSTINECLHQLLFDIFDEQEGAFPGNIINKDMIRERYQCFRSFRKASDTRALEKKVDKNDVDIVNRWRTVEEAKGKRPNRPMRHHYAQFELLLEPFMRYTRMM